MYQLSCLDTWKPIHWASYKGCKKLRGMWGINQNMRVVLVAIDGDGGGDDCDVDGDDDDDMRM